jgi:signal transduction histidine kinase
MYLVDTGFAKDKPERIRQGWEIVQRNVGRIRAMVSDILYYAKDREPLWETISAAELADEVCGLIESRANEHGIRLVRELDRAAGQLEVDPQAVRSMLMNLVENSLDACRLDAKKTQHLVTIRLMGSDHQLQYEIEDNGIGMDRETCDKAFSLFFSSKGSEGTGLGLFIANRIAKAHGGTIQLESQVGVGTKFVVQLPRKRPPAAAQDGPTGLKETLNG